MAYNQVLDFIDNLDTSAFRHIVMFCEEPEYARLVQIRFLNIGLKNRDCCIYWASNDEDISLTKTGMCQHGIDVDRYMNEGILQFHKGTATIRDPESYEHAKQVFRETIEKEFFRAENHAARMPTSVRVVGDGTRNVFSRSHVSATSAASGQLMLEKLFQSERASGFEGVFMCVYWVDDIMAALDESWMRELLLHHDVVLYLRRFTNGIGLDITRRQEDADLP